MVINRLKLEIAMAKNQCTTEELSKISGTSAGEVHRYAGKRTVRPTTVGKLAKALNCQVEDLIEVE